MIFENGLFEFSSINSSQQYSDRYKLLLDLAKVIVINSSLR